MLRFKAATISRLNRLRRRHKFTNVDQSCCCHCKSAARALAAIGSFAPVELKVPTCAGP